MKTTYVVKNYLNEIISYHKVLGDAKRELEYFNNPAYRILCLKGQYYGEGRHVYEITYHRGDLPGGVFLKTKLS